MHLQVEDTKQAIQVSLINAKGNSVISTSGKVEEIEAILSEKLPTLPAGVYVLQVKSGARLYTKKVVKTP